MEKVFIYNDFKHLTKNPPQHNSVDYIFNKCEQELKPVKVSSHEIIHDKKVILGVTGICQEHGEVNYLVTFQK